MPLVENFEKNYNDEYPDVEIDLCSCYEPIIEFPAYLLEEWAKEKSPFNTTIERKIGNTWYLIETVCDGTERLSDKVKRLIFSEKGAICS